MQLSIKCRIIPETCNENFLDLPEVTVKVGKSVGFAVILFIYYCLVTVRKCNGINV